MKSIIKVGIYFKYYAPAGMVPHVILQTNVHNLKL